VLHIICVLEQMSIKKVKSVVFVVICSSTHVKYNTLEPVFCMKFVRFCTFLYVFVYTGGYPYKDLSAQYH